MLDKLITESYKYFIENNTTSESNEPNKSNEPKEPIINNNLLNKIKNGAIDNGIRGAMLGTAAGVGTGLVGTALNFAGVDNDFDSMIGNGLSMGIDGAMLGAAGGAAVASAPSIFNKFNKFNTFKNFKK